MLRALKKISLSISFLLIYSTKISFFSTRLRKIRIIIPTKEISNIIIMVIVKSKIFLLLILILLSKKRKTKQIYPILNALLIKKRVMILIDIPNKN